MYNILENLFASRELYHDMLAPVCEKYGLTQTEMVVLLFLANNPTRDTASDIVEKRGITKSSVSAAVKALRENEIITGSFTSDNHRSVHLKISDKSLKIVEDGKKAQSDFFRILTKNFTEAEQEAFKSLILRVTDNIRSYNCCSE